MSRNSFSCLIRRRWKKEDLATDFICGMRERKESKVKPKLWMREEGASERFIEISVEERDSIGRNDLLKYIRSNFERLIRVSYEMYNV